MDYTDNRGYPFPTSRRETGNGGLHSELLARAIAADLDLLDAGWTDEMQHSTQLLTKSGNDTNIASGSTWPIFFDTIEKQSTGRGLSKLNNGDLSLELGGDGLYNVFASARANAQGAITANCWHRLSALVISTTGSGVVFTRETYYYETQQVGPQDMYTNIEFSTVLRGKDRIQLQYLHTNAASPVTVQASATRLAATKTAGF